MTLDEFTPLLQQFFQFAEALDLPREDSSA